VAHAIWTGAINFGLVTIPVKLQTAIRTNDLRFNFLHKKDEGRINNVRRCSVCGEEVSYDEIERGFEYEKGHYVVLTDEDFKRVNPEATQSVDIVQFVDLEEINPMYFDKPYYLEPEKRGRHAYALLREALRDANKVGVAKVVIRSKEHLAALKPNGDALIAKMLIDTMTEKFEPEKFQDKYREEVTAMIDARAAGKTLPEVAERAPSSNNVVNLMDVLQKSLEASKKRREGGAAADSDDESTSAEKPKKTTRRKRSAA
jgi:DNA end-binding protein Ku